jgi:heptosyltransferase I
VVLPGRIAKAVGIGQHGARGSGHTSAAVRHRERFLDNKANLGTLHFNAPPEHVCLLRLSAIGDTCHAVAALRAFQAAWPGARFTWIIGKVEAKLMTALLPEMEFITFDKRSTLAELGRVRRLLAARRFDLLVDLQVSLRASLAAAVVRATLKLGFDRARARELQWLFTNARIAPKLREHVLDSFMGFVRACGIETAAPRWDVSVPEGAREYARHLVPDERPTLVISPCSSHAARDWAADRYAAVAVHAIGRHDMRVILAGGRSRREADIGRAIVARMQTPGARLINQIGKDTLPQLLGLLSASTVLISPDSGPVHMATMVGLPVIGLYAATNPARAGPYSSRAWCVDKYDAAARRFLGKPAWELEWTRKIEQPGVMDLIEVADVTAKLDALMASRRREPAAAN